MAVDDVLLAGDLETPVLRVYGWSAPAFTIGYFQPYSAAPPGSHTVIRRISGGGVVDHRNDLTFTLVFGATHELFTIDRFESYRRINQVVVDALKSHGCLCSLSGCDIGDDVDRAKMVCFRSPVRFDVVDDEGRKLCGGAQRRKRRGMLHQGSIALEGVGTCREELCTSLVNAFEAFFAENPAEFEVPDGFSGAVALAVSKRYGLDSWNHRK